MKPAGDVILQIGAQSPRPAFTSDLLGRSLTQVLEKGTLVPTSDPYGSGTDQSPDLSRSRTEDLVT